MKPIPNLATPETPAAFVFGYMYPQQNQLWVIQKYWPEGTLNKVQLIVGPSPSPNPAPACKCSERRPPTPLPTGTASRPLPSHHPPRPAPEGVPEMARLLNGPSLERGRRERHPRVGASDVGYLIAAASLTTAPPCVSPQVGARDVGLLDRGRLAWDPAQARRELPGLIASDCI